MSDGGFAAASLALFVLGVVIGRWSKAMAAIRRLSFAGRAEARAEAAAQAQAQQNQEVTQTVVVADQIIRDGRRCVVCGGSMDVLRTRDGSEVAVCGACGVIDRGETAGELVEAEEVEVVDSAA